MRERERQRERVIVIVRESEGAGVLDVLVVLGANCEVNTAP